MNWTDNYELLIEKRKKERPEGYTENHHIFPTCQGGLDIPANKVRLTAKEHLIAHLLLMKMNPEHFGLIHAAFSMSNNKTYTSRKYSWLKEKYSESMRGIPKSEETREKFRKPKSELTRKRMSDSHKGIPRGKISENTRKKMIASHKGLKIQCPHCDKIGGSQGPMNRWHFDNCKFRHFSLSAWSSCRESRS